MPNWSYNHLTVSGKKENVLAFGRALLGKRKYYIFLADVLKERGITYPSATYAADYQAAFEEALNRFRNQPEGEEDLTFNTIVPMPESCHIDLQGAILPDGRAGRDLLYSDEQWYGWSCNHWGTKWDMCNEDTPEAFKAELTRIEAQAEGSAQFILYFKTAWGTPMPFLKAAAKQHPYVVLNFGCEEESGAFFGEIILQGEAVLEEMMTSSRAQWYAYKHYSLEDYLNEETCGKDEETLEWILETPEVLASAVDNYLTWLTPSDFKAQLNHYFDDEIAIEAQVKQALVTLIDTNNVQEVRKADAY